MRFAFFVLSLMFTLAAANAADTDRAVALAEQGEIALKAGDLKEAMDLFWAAWDEDMEPAYLFDAARTAELLGEYEAAVGALRILQGVDDPIVSERARTELVRVGALDHGRSTVRVESRPPSVYVRLDGDTKVVGTTPLELRLKPGVYTLTLDFPGYVAERRRVKVEDGEALHVRVTLESTKGVRVPTIFSWMDGARLVGEIFVAALEGLARIY